MLPCPHSPVETCSLLSRVTCSRDDQFHDKSPTRTFCGPAGQGSVAAGLGGLEGPGPAWALPRPGRVDLNAPACAASVGGSHRHAVTERPASAARPCGLHEAAQPQLPQRGKDIPPDNVLHELREPDKAE